MINPDIELRAYARAKQSGRSVSDEYLRLLTERNLTQKEQNDGREQAGAMVKSQLIEIIHAIGVTENEGVVLRRRPMRTPNGRWSTEIVLDHNGIHKYLQSYETGAPTVTSVEIPLETYPMYSDLALKGIQRYLEAQITK